MVMRKISEMYDLKTTLNRLGVLGIHTPSSTQIARRWAGDLINHRWYRLVGCNIRLACASVLPADPSQIGTVQGTIAPQDIMNPLLYRAVTNESWNTVVSRLLSAGVGTDVNSVKMAGNAFSSMSDDDNEYLYYALLSSDEWRKALPQSGLSMSGLKPLVYPLYSQFGPGQAVANPTVSTVPGQVYSSSTAAGSPSTIEAQGVNPASDRLMRGSARPMPHFACTNGAITFQDDLVVNVPQDAPRTYVAAIVLPPGKLQVFYFRLIVDWFIEFENPVSLLEKLTGVGAATQGLQTYSRQYTVPETLTTLASDAVEVSSVDTVGADSVDLVMEK